MAAVPSDPHDSNHNMAHPIISYRYARTEHPITLKEQLNSIGIYVYKSEHDAQIDAIRLDGKSYFFTKVWEENGKYNVQVYNNPKLFIESFSNIPEYAKIAADMSSNTPTEIKSKSLASFFNHYQSKSLLDTVNKLEEKNIYMKGQRMNVISGKRNRYNFSQKNITYNLTESNMNEHIDILIRKTWEEIMKHLRMYYSIASEKLKLIMNPTTMLLQNHSDIKKNKTMLIIWFLTYRDTVIVLDKSVIQRIRRFDVKTQQDHDIERTPPVAYADRLELYSIRIRSCSFFIILFIHIANDELFTQYDMLQNLRSSSKTLHIFVEELRTLWSELENMSKTLLRALYNELHMTTISQSNINKLYEISNTLYDNNTTFKKRSNEINEGYTVSTLQSIAIIAKKNLYKDTKKYMNMVDTILGRLLQFTFDLKRACETYDTILTLQK
jgi:hypothetical protein